MQIGASLHSRYTFQHVSKVISIVMFMYDRTWFARSLARSLFPRIDHAQSQSSKCKISLSFSVSACQSHRNNSDLSSGDLLAFAAASLSVFFSVAITFTLRVYIIPLMMFIHRTIDTKFNRQKTKFFDEISLRPVLRYSLVERCANETRDFRIGLSFVAFATSNSIK